MKISYQSLLDCASEIDQIAFRVQEIMDELEKVNQTLKSHLDWNGPASDFYAGRFSSLTTTFDSVFSGIKESSTYLKQVVEAHQTMEQSLANEVNNRFDVE